MGITFYTRLRAALVTLICVVFLAGCQNMGGGGKVDPRLTTGDTANFFASSGVQACAAGALVGVAACALSNAGNKAACMAIAAVAGCGAAAGAAYYLDDLRAKSANKEAATRKMIDDITGDNKKLQARMQVVDAVMKDNENTLNLIKQQLASKQGNAKQMQASLADIKANKEYLEKEIVNVNNKIGEYEKAAAQVAPTNSGKENADINKSIKDLTQTKETLLRRVAQANSQAPSLEVQVAKAS
jgi:hypothetical protein